jgi:hypothetical protein
MKTYKHFVLPEGLVYGQDELIGGRKGPYTGPRIDEMDPHGPWEKHYNNSLHLDFIHKHSDNFAEKHQARKELDFARKKMEFWQKHPSFNIKKATEIASRLKKQWRVKE